MQNANAKRKKKCVFADTPKITEPQTGKLTY